MGKKDKKRKAHEVAPAGEQDGDDAGHSGGLLFGSSLDTRIRPLLDAVDSIRNLLQGASLNITLPSIVVAGDQSAGKTSLLEALSGVQLPRGDDIVTRCPLILRLHLDATAKKATLSARDENGGDAGGRLAEREIALEEIDAAVREFQDILAGDQAEQISTTTTTTMGKAFSKGSFVRATLESHFVRCFVDGRAYGSPGASRFEDGSFVADLGENQALHEFLYGFTVVSAMTDLPSCHVLEGDFLALGCEITARSDVDLTVRVGENETAFEILLVNAYTRARNRASVVVRTPDGEIKLYCAGAAAVILGRLQDGSGSADESGSNDDSAAEMTGHLNEFARDCLTSVVLASRTLSAAEWDERRAEVEAAQAAIDGRHDRLADVAEALEAGLLPVGIAAVGDSVQDNQLSAADIARLRESDRTIWIATDASVDRSISAASRLGLIGPSVVTTRIVTDQRNSVLLGLRRLEDAQCWEGNLDRSQVLVMSADALTIAMEDDDICDDLVGLTYSCDAVIASGTPPDQHRGLASLDRVAVVSLVTE